jgi:hypothetical protein
MERGDISGVKPVAVFRFLSEDWSPWIALLRMRERWPELSFKLIPLTCTQIALYNAKTKPTTGLISPDTKVLPVPDIQKFLTRKIVIAMQVLFFCWRLWCV